MQALKWKKGLYVDFRFFFLFFFITVRPLHSIYVFGLFLWYFLQENKQKFAQFIEKQWGIKVNVMSMFDVQVSRLNLIKEFFLKFIKDTESFYS